MSVGKSTVFKLRTYFEMVKFEHTVFALPFAYLGAFWAADGYPSAAQFCWITFAMIGARTFSMALNRIIDREIDARNPRTKDRALPMNLLTVAEVGGLTLVSLFVFLLSVYNLAPITHLLWPLILLPLTLYSYGKRFTDFANFGLGLCLALAPLSAWIAINNSISTVALLITFGVFFWASGFDIVYACQDIDVDRQEGLHSIPAKYGVEFSLNLTKILHILSIASFFAAGLLSSINPLFYFGVLLGALILFYENSIISPQDLSRVNQAFFTVNSFYSVVIFAFALFALLT
jgi:4-hydroxybenzoate polyprenyltransferase